MVWNRRGHRPSSAGAQPSGAPPGAEAELATSYPRPDDATLRRTLSTLAYEVVQRGATEPAFANAYYDHHASGVYVDVATGEPLFASADKFDSGTGWPSFTRPIEAGRVVEHVDTSHGMTRTEARSSSGSHLGHVFDDGPAPTGRRYCINSAALRFVPVDRLAAEGLDRFAPAAVASGAQVSPAPNACTAPPKDSAPGCAATLETAILAGGCFWGMEEILRKVPGVIDTEVGYTGGDSNATTYAEVHRGTTGQAEAVRVVFDPERLSYADLLEKWFFRMHDPTTQDRQGNDVGSQYRSAIFVLDDAQARTAKEVIARVQASGSWKSPVVTEVIRAGAFARAEELHQDYLQKYPQGYTCHYLR